MTQLMIGETDACMHCNAMQFNASYVASLGPLALLTKSLTDGVGAVEPGTTGRAYVLWLHTYCKVDPGSVVTDQTREAIRCSTRSTVRRDCTLCHTCTSITSSWQILYAKKPSLRQQPYNSCRLALLLQFGLPFPAQLYCPGPRP